jgi:uncharacterized protein YuzB (UPF0349 family)
MDSWTTLRNSGTQIDQQYCLQRCGVCHDRPFVVADGETVSGASYEEILNRMPESEREE